MKTVSYWIFGFLGTSLIFFWLFTQIRYRIGSKHLKVTLFGIPLRRVALSNIRHISKRRTGFCEHWWNTWKPNHRMLTIHKHRGLIKNFVMPPRNRYIFMPELQPPIP